MSTFANESSGQLFAHKKIRLTNKPLTKKSPSKEESNASPAPSKANLSKAEESLSIVDGKVFMPLNAVRKVTTCLLLYQLKNELLDDVG